MHTFSASFWVVVIVAVSFSTALSSDVSSISDLSIRDNSDDDDAVNLFLKRFKCFVNICAELSKDYGYEQLWIQTNTELQLHFDDWRKCSKQLNQMLVYAWVK